MDPYRLSTEFNRSIRLSELRRLADDVQRLDLFNHGPNGGYIQTPGGTIPFEIDSTATDSSSTTGGNRYEVGIIGEIPGSESYTGGTVTSSQQWNTTATTKNVNVTSTTTVNSFPPPPQAVTNPSGLVFSTTNPVTLTMVNTGGQTVTINPGGNPGYVPTPGQLTDPGTVTTPNNLPVTWSSGQTLSMVYFPTANTSTLNGQAGYVITTQPSVLALTSTVVSGQTFSLNHGITPNLYQILTQSLIPTLSSSVLPIPPAILSFQLAVYTPTLGLTAVNGKAVTQTVGTPTSGYSFQWPDATPTAGQILTATVVSGSNVVATWTTSGTIASVSVGNLSPLFTTSVATPSTTPSVTFTQVNQSANLVYAGPSSGGSAAPTFRALAAADLPTSVSAWILVNIPYTTLQTLGAVSSGTLLSGIYTLGIKGVISQAFMRINTTFTGTLLSTLTLTLLDSTSTQFMNALSGTAAGTVTGSYPTYSFPVFGSYTATTQLHLLVQETTGTLNNLTAGSVDIWLLVGTLP